MEWLQFFKRKKSEDIESSFDFKELEEIFTHLYLKSLAVDKTTEFLARIVAQSHFLYLEKGKHQENDWSYLLNIEPNKSETASQFWQKFVYRLLTKNEVLVILSDDNQLLIADSYIRKRSALYDDWFETVCVGEYTFKRSFRMSDVIFLQYNNNHLSTYLSDLFDDYQKLYERILEAIARNGQIRGVLKTKVNSSFDDKRVQKLQLYADKLFKSFTNKTVSIVPTIDGVDYEELTNRAATKDMSIDELKKLKQQFEDDIADILGIPVAIRRGDMANLDSNQKIFFDNCLGPLNKKIEDQLNAKIITRSKFKKGHAIKMIGINRRDIFDLATNIDKLISSGTFNINEIRSDLGYDSIEGGETHFITKNYQQMESIQKEE